MPKLHFQGERKNAFSAIFSSLTTSASGRDRSSLSVFAKLSLLAIFALTSLPSVQARTEIILHSFEGTTDGEFPASGLVGDGPGNLYEGRRETLTLEHGVVQPPIGGREVDVMNEEFRAGHRRFGIWSVCGHVSPWSREASAAASNRVNGSCPPSQPSCGMKTGTLQVRSIQALRTNASRAGIVLDVTKEAGLASAGPVGSLVVVDARS
jgi:hypothetical protein